MTTDSTKPLTLGISEVFLSLQGESTFAGLPCIFIRLAGCNLRCSYCDTAYAFTGGDRWPLDGILARVEELARPFPARSTGAGTPGLPPGRMPLLEVTGGEPLIQPNVYPLMRALCDRSFTVLLETSGAVDISPVDPRVRRIMDLKAPSSGESGRNHWDNLQCLKATDEVKFVVGTREDLSWMQQVIARHQLDARCALLCSWVEPLPPGERESSVKPIPAGQTPISRRELAEWLLAEALPVRFQVQLHKIIWPPEMHGV